MRYDDDFRSKVVQDFRDSRDPIATVARRHGVSSSTVVRWDAQAEAAAALADKPLSPEAQEQAELVDLIQRLGRENDEDRLERWVLRHNRRVALWSNVKKVWSFLFGLSYGGVSLLLYFGLMENNQSWRVYGFGWVALTLIFWLISAIVDLLIERLSNFLGGAFMLATIYLFQAQEVLVKDVSGELDDPRLWQLAARLRRRRVRRSLRKAEGTLMRRTTLGRGFQTTSAREWELAQRRRVAGTIGYVETLLELEGFRAYSRSQNLLRQVAWLTILRDWSLTDLPILPEVPPRYQSRFRRVVSRLWSPVPALGVVVALILAVPDLWTYFGSLR